MSKFFLMVLYNEVLSRHVVENHVKQRLNVKRRILCTIFLMRSDYIQFKHIDYQIVQLLT